MDQPATVGPQEAHTVQVPAADFSLMGQMVKILAPEEEVGEMDCLEEPPLFHAQVTQLAVTVDSAAAARRVQVLRAEEEVIPVAVDLEEAQTGVVVVVVEHMQSIPLAQ